MRRIQIIGCSGAGKSTLARALGENTGLPVVHIDRLFWKSGWIESTKAEIDGKILAEMEKECWIMDGNYTRTLEKRCALADLVIYLDFPTWFCLLSVVRRYFRNYGRVRPDMAPGCTEKIDLEFLKWICDYNRSKRPQFYAMLEKLPPERVVVLRSRREVRDFLEKL